MTRQEFVEAYRHQFGGMVLDACTAGLKGEALAHARVEPARAAALTIDPTTPDYAFGVSHIPGRGSPGLLNISLGLPGPFGFGVWREGPTVHCSTHEVHQLTAAHTEETP